MSALLVHVAGYMLICGCVLVAPHASSRDGVAGSVAFSLMSAASIAAFVYMEYFA